MHSLYLFPSDNKSTDSKNLPGFLTAIGLIGSRLDKAHYLVGDEFFRWLSFAGCSPSMELTPQADGGSFVNIRLLGPFAAPKLLTSTQFSRPRCPGCNTRITAWQSIGREFTCPACSQSLDQYELNWKRYGVLGTQFIEVRDIFPGEVMPGEKLLAQLAEHSGLDWKYGWAESSAD